MKMMATLLDFGDLLSKAVTCRPDELEMMELENESQSRVFFAVLASVCSGRALSIVLSVSGGVLYAW